MADHSFDGDQRRRTGVLLAAGTALISGISVFINGYGVRAWAEVSDATTYTTLKNAGAGAILLGVLALASRTGRSPGVSQVRANWRGLLLIAFIGGSIPFVLFFEGLALATSRDAAFIHKTLVVWVAILAVVFLRERLGRLHVAALALLVIGQVAISGGVGVFDAGAGELMILAATLFWAVETVVAKRVLASVPALTVAVFRMVGGVVLLFGFGLARGALGLSGIGLEHIVWILVTALTLSAYVATWFSALSRAPAVDITAILVGGAIITGLLESGVRDVAFPPALGLILIGVGVLLAGVAGWRRPRLA
jgi:drug/metabolite transporter (DMT)-like permease